MCFICQGKLKNSRKRVSDTDGQAKGQIDTQIETDKLERWIDTNRTYTDKETERQVGME